MSASHRGTTARQSALIDEFAEISGTNEEVAASYLQRSHWSLECALDMFYRDGAPGAGSCKSSMNIATGMLRPNRKLILLDVIGPIVL
ncbi:hypothetical protein Pmar_PMAR000832 [Perkinsus marinus ATCC 50983]|uniref:Uncharacterized protein n=1 Tax=Perkinsus marinus (strain ATCC 50983 / TXsc) TaxID=423536 RepID=C5KXR4_PERM5|nr:hypothetical protein Pmar_PMAR000832 [Perkinsus marinus ATCC 50983]EER10788.1 hypothetical protein Pmar_PMAR000832 [Perkinsus marinus ATCC 50983]|eukprot:XP_002778993.1 hypothetical protein Pmar_PMAR000832 [Perkinsus marinus ATCC 50983]